ncbi:MAG: GNAT family N-acetyltransferase [Candidatus Micrarchaeota archaeon]
MVEIVKYSKKDFSQVNKIINTVTSKWGSGWKELISEMFRNESSCPFKLEKFVAKDKGEVLGLLVLKKEICASVIYFLAAKPGRRREGIGSELLKRAESFAKNSKCSFLRVDVYDKYERNKRFYLKNGFRESGLVKNYYEFGDKQAFFFKKIR